MATEGGPNIITDSLALALDPANTKSYPGSGTTWSDVSGKENNGALVNNVVHNSENSGVLLFDGINEYCQLENSLEDELDGSEEATLIMWIKLNSGRNNSTNSGIIQLTGDTNSNGNLYFYTDSARIGGIWLNIFRTNRVFTGDWQPTLDGSNWHMLTVTSKPGTNGWKMYLNSDLKFQITGQNVISVDSTLFGGFRIGRNSSRSIRGRISNTLIYNRALTPEEILQNYNATKNRFGL